MYLYLHGFNSSGVSAKGKYFRDALVHQPVQTPSYPPQPDAAIAMLQHVLETLLHGKPANEPLILIGSSLGGFYAQYLAHHFALPKVLINPALQPLQTLRPYLGRQTNFYTGEQYDLTEQQLRLLLRFDVSEPCTQATPTLVLLDAGDEIIDYRYAQRIYSPCAQVIVYPEGDHQFQHLAEAVEAINVFTSQIM